MLMRQGLIDAWHDRRIMAGDEFEGRIGNEIDRADIVLLLVSPDFLASDYCYDVEVRRAMDRHLAGETRVIPVILRPCDWHPAPFGKLLAAPKDGKPIMSWPDLDEAFLDVVRMIRAALPASPRHELSIGKKPNSVESGPRSSNLRLRKDFTEADRDKFLEDAFAFMTKFFENSLAELKQRNQGIEFRFKRIDADHFTAVVYRNGSAVSRCKIALGGTLGRGITFSYNDQAADGSINESLAVQADSQGLFLKALGMAHFEDDKDKHLTFEGAAEYYWAMFISRLQ